MEVHEIIASLEQLQALGEYTKEQEHEIEELYYMVFREEFTPTSCTNCYHDAVDKAWAYIRKHRDVVPHRDFLLKYGAVVNVGEFGSGEFYIRGTLTDELAIKFLAKDPDGINQFERFPPDWKERIEHTKEAEKPTTKKKKTK